MRPRPPLGLFTETQILHCDAAKNAPVEDGGESYHAQFIIVKPASERRVNEGLPALHFR